VYKRQGEDRSDQLFNITEDPHETTDLAKKRPEILAELQQMLKQEMASDAQAKRAIWGKKPMGTHHPCE